VLCAASSARPCIVTKGHELITVHNFSDGLVNPVLGYVISCLGAFLGLRCVTRGSCYQGLARARWLAIAATAIGATGGLIVGIGVATMHYLGMAAMVMPDSMSCSPPLFILSVVIAVVAGTAALWIGTWVRGVGATIGASLVMGAAVSGMHYTGMAAMRVYPGAMPGMQGASGGSFLLPLVLGISVITFVLTIIISLSPNEDEIRDDAEFRSRLETLQRRAG
jgi:NO-binding membrane sensor protein with MHYT domain